jgi:hypothetical protein
VVYWPRIRDRAGLAGVAFARTNPGVSLNVTLRRLITRASASRDCQPTSGSDDRKRKTTLTQWGFRQAVLVVRGLIASNPITTANTTPKPPTAEPTIVWVFCTTDLSVSETRPPSPHPFRGDPKRRMPLAPCVQCATHDGGTAS